MGNCTEQGMCGSQAVDDSFELNELKGAFVRKFSKEELLGTQILIGDN